MPNFVDFGRNPFVLIATILAIFLVLIFGLGGFTGFLAAGGAAKAFAGLLAFAFFIGAVRITRFLTLTLDPGAHDAIRSNPVARALLSAGIFLSCAIVTLAVFG